MNVDTYNSETCQFNIQQLIYLNSKLADLIIGFHSMWWNRPKNLLEMLV